VIIRLANHVILKNKMGRAKTSSKNLQTSIHDKSLKGLWFQDQYERE
jgi:hypothetical protein